MISIEWAKKISEGSFPNGPEELAARLGIDVRVSPLSGCDGWVLSVPTRVVIRLNENASPARRRFTLAHELGHLLLGIPTIVGESIRDSLRSNSVEERSVNDLAGELLLPESIVRQRLPSVPVVATQFRKLAKTANVSELAVAIRVANLAKQIGLVNASVAFFQDDNFEWQWSKTLKMAAKTALRLLEDAKACAPQPARIPQNDKIIVASMIENPAFGSATLFVQLLPQEAGNQLSEGEHRRDLEDYLFRGDNAFRMQMQGVFGAFHPKCKDLSLDSAFALFMQAKGERWDGARRTRLHSVKGREYIRLRLEEWCS